MGKRGAATLPLTKQALEAASTKQAPKAVCSAAQRACACDHSARARAHHPPCAPLPAPPHLGTLVEATHCGWPPGSSCCLLRRLPCLPCTGEHMGSGCQWEQCASGSNVPERAGQAIWWMPCPPLPWARQACHGQPAQKPAQALTVQLHVRITPHVRRGICPTRCAGHRVLPRAGLSAESKHSSGFLCSRTAQHHSKPTGCSWAAITSALAQPPFEGAQSFSIA